jgi:antitoxin (DNA-binding transcriptional repressor) of toxin-antitoxin stability system
MSTVTIEEAQANLPQLLASLAAGQIVQTVDRGRPIARLIGEGLQPRPPRQPGSAIGQLFIVAEDEEYLRDFEEYMS